MRRMRSTTLLFFALVLSLSAVQRVSAQTLAPEPAQPVAAEPAQPLAAEPAQPLAPEPAQPLAPEPAQPVSAPPPTYTLPPPAYEAVEAQKPDSRDIVFAYNRGLRFGISPGIMIAPSSGDIGFSIAGDVRYGFQLGPTVLAPGIRLAGYFPPGDTILVGLGTARVVFPVGPVGPYIVGGVGPGWIKDLDEVGLAWLAGAGFMVHIGTRFGIGAEANYQAITSTPFDALFIGPQFLLGF